MLGKISAAILFWVILFMILWMMRGFSNIVSNHVDSYYRNNISLSHSNVPVRLPKKPLSKFHVNSTDKLVEKSILKSTPSIPVKANAPSRIEILVDSIHKHLEEPILKNVIGMPIHFGIIMSTYPRFNDKFYLLPSLTSLRSLLNQTYHNWTLVIAGDGLKGNQTRNFLDRLSIWNFSKDKVIFVNLPVNLTERYLHSKKRYVPCKTATHGREDWCHSGTSALNLAARTAAALPHVTHLAIADDDDFAFAKRLEYLVEAFTRFPDAYFAYSSGYYLGKQFPEPTRQRYNVRDITPLPGECARSISSLWAWKLSDQPEIARLFYYYHDFTQMKYNPKGRRGFSIANDADLQDRVNEFALKRNYSNFSVFIPFPSGLAFTRHERAPCIDRMTADFQAGAVTDVVAVCYMRPLAESFGYYGPVNVSQIVKLKN